MSAFERRLRGELDDGPVDHRIRERDTHLDRICSGCCDAAQRVEPIVGHAGHQVGNEDLSTGVARLPQMYLEIRSRHFPRASRMSRTCATSLSPRPERVTRTVEPVGIPRPASRMTQASAWAGSRAGMMPSVFDRI